LASTSCNEIARRLLDCCLSGAPWPRSLLKDLLEHDGADALFRIVVEGMADRFEPALCDSYAELFAEAVAHTIPQVNAAALVERYRRVRKPRKFQGGSVEKVFVLSRVTLGADVAVTSVILDAAKRRFTEAEIHLVGPRKNWELFAADPRILHQPASHAGHGTLRERLAPWEELKQALSQPRSIVIDPDSRLTQLGLLPVCADENYFFFESRAYGGSGEDPLPVLARRWMSETFGAEGHPYIAPHPPVAIRERPMVSISLGVGDNPAKRLPDPFEQELLREIVGRRVHVWIDKGAGGEEGARVERAVAQSVGRVQCWEEGFAAFAAIIAQADLYIGYDSAGQHVAAACGVPLISVFAGFPTLRMFARWRPWGQGPAQVIRVDVPDPGSVLESIRCSDLLAATSS
jgi:ADP-heptose:LPS heptosyltransferase